MNQDNLISIKELIHLFKEPKRPGLIPHSQRKQAQAGQAFTVGHYPAAQGEALRMLFQGSKQTLKQVQGDTTKVLAGFSANKFLQLNSRVKFKDTELILSGDEVNINQDLRTTDSPEFSDLALSSTSNQIVVGGNGTITWTPTAARVGTIPDASGTFLFDTATQTITNKTISGSSNTLSNIGNSALSNSKITINSGTNITGGGDVSLGGSITLGVVAAPSFNTVTPNADLTYDLGSATLRWNNVYAGNIFATASGTQGFWQRNDGALAPTNITDSLNLGATATSSALVHLAGTAEENSWINTGNVGIGTTSPTSKLHVAGQCVTGDTLLLRRKRRKKKKNGTVDDDESDYEPVRIDQINPGDEILTLNEETGEFEEQRIEKLMDMGVKMTFRLTTSDGKEIRTTAEHPYLVQMVSEPDSSFMADLTLETVKDFAHKYYDQVLSGHRVFVPALREEVALTDAGWNHLRDKPRSDFELMTRFFALPKLIPVLSATEKIFRHDHRIEHRRRVDYWEFRETVDGIKVKVLVRSVSRGPKHFYSIVWRGEDTIKAGDTVLRFIQRPQGVDTLQYQAHQALYTTFVRELSRFGIAGPEALSKLFDRKWVKVRFLRAGMEIAVLGKDGKLDWQEIKAIEKVGEEQVYDIQVANTHNFVGNGIVAHNTYLAGGNLTAPIASLSGTTSFAGLVVDNFHHFPRSLLTLSCVYILIIYIQNSRHEKSGSKTSCNT